jgi:hypothetical protein
MPLVVPENEIMAMWTTGARTHYWLCEAEECKACHEMHYFFVGLMNGLTTCTACAPEEGR